ncbi:MAG: hemolysin family protein [Candidatus Muiribacteriota bacterium]
MEDGDYLNLIIIGLLIVLSAFFSGSETAFFSIDKFKYDKIIKKNRFVYYLLERPRKLLITIILGNLFVNILATITATTFFVNKYGQNHGNTISAITMTLVLLFFGEITPKMIAVNYSAYFVRYLSPFIRLIMYILTPISNLLLFIVNKILKIFGMNEYSINKHISQEELKTIIDMGSEEGVIKTDETKMLRSVFEFSDTSVGEIMTPRIDMVCVDIKLSISNIKRIIKEEQFSRIPVYEDSIDNIIGILYIKDILLYLSGIKEMDDLKKHLRKAYFVPETKRAYSLLNFMQKHKTHIVMVSDEYGGTEGLVTMEDIIEELVGEIHDEHDIEDIEYKFIDNNTLEVYAKIHTDTVNELLGLSIPDHSDYNTMGGYVMHVLGRIPNENDLITLENFDIKVLKMDFNRIETLRIIRKV